jgi:hypothetical protein
MGVHLCGQRPEPHWAPPWANRSPSYPSEWSAKNGELVISVGAEPKPTDIVLIPFRRRVRSSIGGGENAGRTLEEFNVARGFRMLGRTHAEPVQWRVSLDSLPQDATNVAVLAQRTDQGEVLGAARVEIVSSQGLDIKAIADISACGWIDRAPRVFKGDDDTLASFSNVKRLFEAVDARPAAPRARRVGQGHVFKEVNDEEALRALFPSNFRRPDELLVHHQPTTGNRQTQTRGKLDAIESPCYGIPWARGPWRPKRTSKFRAQRRSRPASRGGHDRTGLYSETPDSPGCIDHIIPISTNATRLGTI